MSSAKYLISLSTQRDASGRTEQNEKEGDCRLHKDNTLDQKNLYRPQGREGGRVKKKRREKKDLQFMCE